jgi:hypothetical protein
LDARIAISELLPHFAAALCLDGKSSFSKIGGLIYSATYRPSIDNPRFSRKTNEIALYMENPMCGCHEVG